MDGGLLCCLGIRDTRHKPDARTLCSRFSHSVRRTTTLVIDRFKSTIIGRRPALGRPPGPPSTQIQRAHETEVLSSQRVVWHYKGVMSCGTTVPT